MIEHIELKTLQNKIPIYNSTGYSNDGGNYGMSEGIAFIGSQGTLVVNRVGWQVIPEKDHRNGG